MDKFGGNSANWNVGDKFGGNSANWNVGDIVSESTSDPSVSMVADEVSTLTVPTILGVAVVILVAIAAVFMLGVMIDWRQQRLLDKKLDDVKRMKNQRRSQNSPETDIVNIADNMEEDSLSTPPADSLRHIP